MQDEGFTVTRVREISALIQDDFYARNCSAFQKCKGNIIESVVLQEILKGQQLIIQQNNQLKEEHINLKQTNCITAEKQENLLQKISLKINALTKQQEVKHLQKTLRMKI